MYLIFSPRFQSTAKGGQSRDLSQSQSRAVTETSVPRLPALQALRFWHSYTVQGPVCEKVPLAFKVALPTSVHYEDMATG